MAEAIDTRRPATYDDVASCRPSCARSAAGSTRSRSGSPRAASPRRRPSRPSRRGEARVGQAQAARSARADARPPGADHRRRELPRLRAGRAAGARPDRGVRGRARHAAAAVALERTEFIDADMRDPVIATLIPPLEVDTVVHNQIVRQPGARHVPAGDARHQRDRLAPAAGRLREGADDPDDHHPRLGRHLRGRAARAPVLHRGDGAPVSASHALPARRRRDRELLRDLLAPPPGGGLHDAALPAGDRALASTRR